LDAQTKELVDSLRDQVTKIASRMGKKSMSTIITPKLTFLGDNSLDDAIIFLATYLEADEKRILVICDKDLRKFGEMVSEALKTRRAIDAQIFDDVLPEVPLNRVLEAVEVCKAYKPGVIIGLGGGSAIDMAKIVMILYEKPTFNLKDVTGLISPNIGLRKKVRLLGAIPTTSGTGAEATYNAMALDDTVYPPRKFAVPYYDICPDFVVLHVDFVKSMPKFLTIGTGLDVFAHAVGAQAQVQGNDFTDMHNIKAIEMVLKYLPRAVANGNDLEAREKMMLAAYIAGIGFMNSAVGVDHPLGHALGAAFHVHHGLAVGVFLPASVSFLTKVSTKIFPLAKLFGIKINGMDREQVLRALLLEIHNFMRKIEAPTSIGELQRPTISLEQYREKMEFMIEHAYYDLPTLLSSRRVTKAHLKLLFECAYNNEIGDLVNLMYI